jgi:DNA-binding NarL/FixJ family response regulator
VPETRIGERRSRAAGQNGAAESRNGAAKAGVALIAPAAEGVRAKIGEALGAEGFDCIEFESVESLIESSDGETPEAVVMWIDDTESSPAPQVELLRKSLGETPIVAVCEGIERWEIRAALAGGVAGVVLAEEMEKALGHCLRAAKAGQVCVPKRHWRQIEPPVLSTREKQILGLVVMGCMNSQIAERLYLAESTVKSHLSSAFGKLGVRSRNEAVNLILDGERGLGMGILGLGVEPVMPERAAAQ